MSLLKDAPPPTPDVLPPEALFFLNSALFRAKMHDQTILTLQAQLELAKVNAETAWGAFRAAAKAVGEPHGIIFGVTHDWNTLSGAIVPVPGERG